MTIENLHVGCADDWLNVWERSCSVAVLESNQSKCQLEIIHRGMFASLQKYSQVPQPTCYWKWHSWQLGNLTSKSSDAQHLNGICFASLVTAICCLFHCNVWFIFSVTRRSRLASQDDLEVILVTDWLTDSALAVTWLMWRQNYSLHVNNWKCDNLTKI